MILCLQAMVFVSLFSTALDLSERLVPTENPSSTVATIFCQPSAHWHVFCTVVRELFADSRESRILSRAAHGKKKSPSTCNFDGIPPCWSTPTCMFSPRRTTRPSLVTRKCAKDRLRAPLLQWPRYQVRFVPGRLSWNTTEPQKIGCRWLK